MMKEAVSHTKIKRLCRRMQIPRWKAVGLLESIWILTELQAPAGDIGRLSDEDIAVGIEYEEDEKKLIENLVETGWLDRHPKHRLLIHDWPDHCSQAIHMKLARNRLFFASGQAPKTTRLGKWERDTADVFYNTRKNPSPTPADPREVVGELENVRTKPESVRTPSAQTGTLCAPPHPTPPHPTPPLNSSSTTHTQAPTSKNGHAKVGVCVSSTRFVDWWKLWSDVRGTNHHLKAKEAFPRLVPVELEAACFECTASYLRSLNDPARGYHPENFLAEQAKERFAARWPASNNRAAPKESLTDRTVRVMNERMARGEKPL